MKNPLTPAGIEPATFRIVAQHLSHCATAVPKQTWYLSQITKYQIVESCLTVHLPHEIMWNANLMQQGNFIGVFSALHVSGAYAHHQEH